MVYSDQEAVMLSCYTSHDAGLVCMWGVGGGGGVGRGGVITSRSTAEILWPCGSSEHKEKKRILM